MPYGLSHCVNCSNFLPLYSGPMWGQKEYQCFTLPAWWAACPVLQHAVCSSDRNCDNSYMFVEGLKNWPVGQCVPLQCGIRSCANVVS